jgi:S-adenosyl methyltransferase
MTQAEDAAPATPPDDMPPGVDPSRPSPARLYDYFLGGANYLPVDREVAEKLKAAVPDFVDTVLANRGFHGRAAVWMARQGIRQFIDLGSGLPTQNNTHESVHRVARDARVVYVDNDPIVAAHGSRLLAPGGSTAVVTADLREPDAVLGHRQLRRLIDFTQPAGVLMTAVLHFVADGSDPWGLVARYMAAVAPGSYLALSHGTYDKLPPVKVRSSINTMSSASEQMVLRSRAEVERFFNGLELVPPYQGAEPGLTYVGVWGAEDAAAADTDGSRWGYCGVARRPEGFTVRARPGGERANGGSRG